MVVGIRHDEQRHQHDHGRASSPEYCARPQQGDDGDQEDQRQARQQHGQRDFVGRLLALGALDQRDHAVEEASSPAPAVTRTLIQSETTVVPPVTAERSPPDFADHRRGFAGDRRIR